MTSEGGRGDDRGNTEPQLTLVRNPARAGDAELAGRIRAGDAAAFETVFRAYHARLVPFAACYVGSVAVADEVVADVFAWLWERRADWHPGVSIASYLYGAVRNRALNEAKRAAGDRRRVAGVAADGEIPGAGESPLDAAQRVERDDDVAAAWRAIMALPERRRLILTLRWRHELSWDEIAAMLGTTSAAVQMDHSRALRRLRETLRGK